MIGALLGLFTGKFRALAWLGLAGVIVALGGLAATVVIRDLRADKEILRLEKEALRRDNEALNDANRRITAEHESFIGRANAIAEQMGSLNRRMNENLTTREADISAMTSETRDPAELQQRANSGMNGLFEELERMSR